MKTVTLSRRLYQRDLPIYIAAFIIGFMIVQYFVQYQPLDALRAGTLQWANITSLFVWAFANVVLVLNSSRRILRAREDRRVWYESILIVGSMSFFLLLALTDPAKLDQNPLYTTVYKGLIGAIYLAVESVSITYISYYVTRRLIMMNFTSPENLILIATYVIMRLRGMTLVTYNLPVTLELANWIEKVAYTAVLRAATIVTALSSLILATRALVGKEPGIIEAEIG